MYVVLVSLSGKDVSVCLRLPAMQQVQDQGVSLLDTPIPTPLPRTMGVKIDAAGLANSRSGRVNAGM